MTAALPLETSAVVRERVLPPLILCLLWVLFWYHETILAMVEIWARSDTFAHGFVVPPIALWLIWRRRRQIAEIPPQPAPWTLLLIAAAALCWLLGALAAVNAVTQFALVALLVLTVPALCGLEAARALAFPLAFLFFAVPAGEFVTPHLMEWTARFTVLGLRLSGIPVYREGLQFVIPSGNWSVVEACSGIRYLIASTTVGVLFAYLNYASLKRRLLFVAVAIVVPIIANWLRAYMIVMLGHLSNNRLAAGVDHLIYGWLFFGLVIMLMFIIGARWADNRPPPSAPATSRLVVAKAADSASFWVTAALLAALTAVPVIADRLIEARNIANPPLLPDAIADLSGGWRRAPSAFTDWRPLFASASAELQNAYTDGQHSVGLYIGYYRNQDYGHKLISSTNVLVPSHDSAWVQVSEGRRPLRSGRLMMSMRAAELRPDSSTIHEDDIRLLVWQVYWINGHLTANDYAAKVHTALSRLLGQGDDSAVIVFYAPFAPPNGEEALAAFAEANLARIAAVLTATKEGR